MRERRFLVPELGSGVEIEILGPEAHHLIHVLRLREGDEIVVFDGRGKAVRAALSRVDRSSARAKPLEELPSRESPLALTVAIALPKADTMSWVVQKLTELGAARIVPVTSERALGAASSRQTARWRRIAAEACKQSGRAVLPAIEEPSSFRALLDRDFDGPKLLASPEGRFDLPAARPSSCLAAIGPEGGWSPAEKDEARAAGFRTLGLGARTLRTETAAIAAAAILQWEWGDLGAAGAY